MKTIFYSAFMCFLALLLGGCSKTSVDESASVDGGNAWLAMTITLPTFDMYGTRSVAGVNNDDEYQGTTDEQKVTAARVVLYEQATATVKYSFDITSSDVTTGAFTYPKFTLKAKQLRKENFDVLVLLNPTEKVKAVTVVGQTKAQFEAAAAEEVNNLVSAAKGVFMCNSFGYASTSDGNWRFSAAEAEATNVPLQVSVERSVAKVFVGNEQGTTIPSDNGLATMNVFSLDMINKKLFWMRKPNLVLTGSGTATTDAPTAAEQSNTAQKYKYAIDPNMGIFTTPSAVEFAFNGLTPLAPTSTGGFDDDKGIYVTENVMNADAQRSLGSTRVLFNIVYIPNALRNKMPTVKHWANYKGKLLTKAELDAKLQDALTMTDEQMDMPSGFKASAAALRAENYTRSFENHGLKYYHNGENYYSSYIRHFDDVKQPKLMAYGRYGVLRNHIYKITVTKVSGPGDPEPKTPVDEPDDKPTTYIQISVVVAPWTVVPQAPITLD